MYYTRVGYSCDREIFFPDARTFDFSKDGYFDKPLEYRLSPPAMLYRLSSYVSLFDIGMMRPFYAGVSPIERYLTRNALKMQVDLEYKANAPVYIPNSLYGTIQLTFGEIHNPEEFLLQGEGPAEFIGEMSPMLKRKIELLFRLTIGFNLPDSISINIMSGSELEREHRKHTGSWSREIHGFAINRMSRGERSSIFVKQNPLDVLLLTIGHEIGHCLTLPHKNKVLEEAKAFAFELAWMKTIHRFDILGIGSRMNISLLSPSNNGIHNTAFGIVKREMINYKDPLIVFRKIARDEINI